MNPQSIYRYLIGFHFSNGEAASVAVGLPGPITNEQDVLVVRDDLRRHYGDPQLIVLSFSLFAEVTR
jgi:hypothetical protein